MSRAPYMKTTAAIAALALAAIAGAAHAAPAAALKPLAGPNPTQAASWAPLPDWSGVWKLVGPTTFDTATATPKGGVAGRPGVREHPPYNGAWEKKYQANLALVAAGKFVDPVSTCGTPAGMPRMLNLRDGMEWVVRPELVYNVSPNGGSVRRIFTDGRKHLQDDDLYATYTGDNVGHWEGQTLVIDTIGLRDDTLLDLTGLIHSEDLHVVQRVRRVGADILEVAMTLDDKTAFTRPWKVTKRFRREKGPAYVYDFACAENNPDPLHRDGRLNESSRPAHS